MQPGEDLWQAERGKSTNTESLKDWPKGRKAERLTTCFTFCTFQVCLTILEVLGAWGRAKFSGTVIRRGLMTMKGTSKFSGLNSCMTYRSTFSWFEL